MKNTAWIEMEVCRVHIAAKSPHRVVLKEKKGDACLQIVIGPFEAVAISMAHNGQKPLRPISYDLICSILGEIDARIGKVEITDLHEGTYYAEVYLQSKDGTQTVLDSRPSDAIALALRAGAPIYASALVLEEEAVQAVTAPKFRPDARGRKSAEALGIPPVPQRAVDRLQVLKKRLLLATAEEAYEEAARLRDEIICLEGQRD